MESLKIAFYSDTYLPAVDGVVTSMLNAKAELERLGHEVFIFTSGDARSKRRYANRHVFVMQGVKFRPYPQYKLAIFPYHAVFKAQSLNLDIIHAQTPFAIGFTALLTAKLLRYPIIGSYHTMVNDKALEAYHPKSARIKKFTTKYLWKYTKFFYRRCDATIAPSSTVEKMLKRYKIKGVHIVPNAVDLKKFNPKVSGEPFRKRFGIKEREKVVLYVGRISKEKNIDVLLKAAHELRKRNDVRFVIGGTGPMLASYREMALRMGLSNVRFLGFVSDALLPSLYAASDMLCTPSTFETQGIVPLEAMATGKPVVAANALALKEMVKNGKNGEKFDPGNYLQCAKKIEKVLNNGGAYKESAVRTAKEFSVEKVTEDLVDVYKLVLSNSEQAIY